MDKYIFILLNYINDNYDIDNDLVKSKYNHSVRVADAMYELASRLNLTNEEKILAFKIGLFHDLGRFKEVNRNGKFNNLIFDHGAYSNKILYNDGLINKLDIKDDEHMIVKKAIYYHNKKTLGNDLNDEELLFAQMLRDVDKIDILLMRANGKRMFFYSNYNIKVIEDFFNDLSIDLKDVRRKSDSIILYLSFLKDLYYDESYDMATEKGCLEKLLNVIDVDIEEEDVFYELIKKVKERGKGYVREKV